MSFHVKSCESFFRYWQRIAALLFAVLPLSVFAAASSLQLSVLHQPVPVASSDKQLLVYELQFVNQSDQPVRIGRIEVFGDHNNKIAAYAGNKLIRNSLAYKDNKKIDLEQSIELNKGMGVFVFVWISIDKSSSPPKKLHHKIWVVKPTADKNSAPTSLINYDVNVSSDKPVVISSPLKGNGWVAAAGPTKDSYHRKALLNLGGKLYLAQRFAIDWIQICPDGTAAQGNLRDNNNWPGFGHEVMAVADGEVVTVHDGVPENTPLEPLKASSPNAIKEADIPGNHVIEKITQNGKNYYVLYAHMQPGTLRVKVGDRIKEGQLIGLLGNTGNSTVPHLHLHVSDANDPLKSEGVPFIFKTATLEGKAELIDEDFEIWKPFSLSKTEIKDAIPTIDQVFYFSNDASRCKSAS